VEGARLSPRRSGLFHKKKGERVIQKKNGHRAVPDPLPPLSGARGVAREKEGKGDRKFMRGKRKKKRGKF